MKQGLNYRQSLAVLKKKYKEFTPALSVILWTLSGIYAIAKSHFNTSVSGVTLSFVVSDLLMMSLASLILCKGLVDVSFDKFIIKKNLKFCTFVRRKWYYYFRGCS